MLSDSSLSIRPSTIDPSQAVQPAAIQPTAGQGNNQQGKTSSQPYHQIVGNELILFSL